MICGEDDYLKFLPCEWQTTVRNNNSECFGLELFESRGQHTKNYCRDASTSKNCSIVGQMTQTRLEWMMSCAAAVKMSWTCETVTVNINILHVSGQAWSHRKHTCTCVHTSINLQQPTIFLCLSGNLIQAWSENTNTVQINTIQGCIEESLHKD